MRVNAGCRTAAAIIVLGALAACGRAVVQEREGARPAAIAVQGAAAPVPSAAAPAPWPNVRPLDDRAYERTPARRARGEYLVEGLLQCAVCHSERDWSQPGAPPVDGRKLAGFVWWEREGRRLVAPNLTSDDDTGIGRWTDDMLARAIREGVSHDGRPLHPQMWYGAFAALTDEDLAAVIVYLRSVSPVRNPLPRTELPENQLRGIAAGLKPITAPVAAPPQRTPAERGAYLLAVADCAGCHSSWHTKRMPGLFGGGNEIERGGVRVVSANLTPDPTGLMYSVETFQAVMRTGRWNTISATMPWIAFRHLDDRDLADMYAALATVSPVSHAIGNGEAPTYCEVCGGTHGGGGRNVLRLPAAAAVDAATLARYAGRYRFADFDETVVLELRDGALWFSVNGGDAIRTIPTSGTRFAVPGWTTPIEFDVDADGTVRAFHAVSPWPDRYERVPP